MGRVADRLRILLHAIDLFLQTIALLLNWNRSCVLEDYSNIFVQFVDMVLAAYTTWMFVLLVAACSRERLEPKTDKILIIVAAILNLLVVIILVFDYCQRSNEKSWSLACLIFVVGLTVNYFIEALMIVLIKPPPEEDA